jgi:hypothetical protein
VAESVDRDPQFRGHSLYRFNESRTDFRFYLDHGVAYYRLVETAIPQAISQWYFGSGGTVGFHTITGLAALDDLLRQRDAGTVRCRIWPQESWHPTDVGEDHLIVESYPAMCPKLASFGPCEKADEQDAWKVLQWMINADERDELGESFSPAPPRFGRVTGIDFWEQVRFEGWILGVR